MRLTEVPMGEVRSFATYFDEYVAKTRAWEPPTTDYVAYEDGVQTIGIAFTQNGEEAIKGTFYKSGNWHFNVTDPTKNLKENSIAEGVYYLYGYIPNTSGITFNITDRSGNNGTGANYEAGAKVVLQNVPTVMPKDLCVVIGAKHGFKQGEDDYYDGGYTDTNGNDLYDNDDTRTNRLRRGDFAYTAQTISKESGAGNYVFLLFDHLYAALRVKMKVYGDYDELRTIKLKKLYLSTKAGETTSKDKYTITVNLQANDGSSSPITGISYDLDPTGNTIGEDGLSFWSSDAGETLTTDFKSFTGHFMPSGITTLVLTSEYDVYDKKGNLIRKDCEATNTMVLSSLISEQTYTQRGRRYTVNMTIQPTYLYVMSDPDLNNPTVVVN